MRGTSCPAPLLGAKKIVDDLRPGEVLLLLLRLPGHAGRPLLVVEVHRQPASRAPSGWPDGSHAYYIRRGRAQHLTPNAVLDLRGVVCPGPRGRGEEAARQHAARRDAEARQQLPRRRRRRRRLGQGDRLPAARDRRDRARASSSSTSARPDADQEPLVQGRARRSRREEIAGAAAFIVWRVAQNSLKTMRAAQLRAAARAAVLRLPRRVPDVPDAGRRPPRAPPRRRGVARRVHHGDGQPRRRDPRRERVRPARRRDRGRRQAPLHRAGQRLRGGMRRASTGPTRAPTTGSCAGSAIASPTMMDRARPDVGDLAGDRGRGARGRRDAAPRRWPACSTPTPRRRGARRACRRRVTLAAAAGAAERARPRARRGRSIRRDDGAYRGVARGEARRAIPPDVADLRRAGARSAGADRRRARARSPTAAARANMAVYASPDDRRRQGPAARCSARQFGLDRLDRNWLADDDGISSVTVAGDGGRGDYIPYTNRPIRWHTDGYYNPPERRIRAMVLHCVRRRRERRRERAARPRDRVPAAARRRSRRSSRR